MKDTEADFVTAPSKALYETFYDLVVVGAGYAGYAAATTAAKKGKKVLLVDPRCDLLWESSHARHPDSGPWTDDFKPLGLAISLATGIAADWIDPGSAEWVANELLLESQVKRLYFAAPLAVERDSTGAIARVTFAVRYGLCSISAAQWIDATEQATLARLCDPSLVPAWPERRLGRLFLQHLRWPFHVPSRLPVGLPGATAYLEPSGWSSECVIRVDLDNAYSRPAWMAIQPVLESFHRRFGVAYDDAFVSHWSFNPYPVYEAERKATPSPAPNLALAVPGLASGTFYHLVDRFTLGVSAVRKLSRKPSSFAGKKLLGKKPAPPVPIASIETDLFVAGLGCAGMMAAVAGARAGVKVLAVEPQYFPGGVSTNGGIPGYYYGVPGGLQREFDQAVQEISPLFADEKSLSSGFHPLARRIVDESFLASAGVSTFYQSMVISVNRKGSKVTELLLSTPSGAIRILSRAWIDATGEGTLCGLAGVPFRKGRTGDGFLNAYTQTWGAFGYFPGGLFLLSPNEDCGYVDPDDSVDMTRARIEGIHFLVEHSPVRTSNAFNRTTGVMPTLGLRQGRLVETVAKLTIDDLVERRRFPDAIGFTGGHYDNHSRDFFAESDAAAFYNWCAVARFEPTACEIPYGAILPVGLSNVWIACRAAGSDEESSNCFRMQRDMQRIGEAAGIAAALAIRHDTANTKVPLTLLRAALDATGALDEPSDRDVLYGPATTTFEGDPALTGPASAENISRWIAALKKDCPGIALWRIYRQGLVSGRRAFTRLTRPLLESKKGAASWNAALLLGAWGNKIARRRLVQAIRNDEKGVIACKGAPPRSLAAVWALGRCGTPADYAVLANYAMDRVRNPIARLAAVWSCADIASRAKPATDRQIRLLSRMLDGIEDCEAPLRPYQRPFVAERLRKALGLPPDESDAKLLREDPSLLARRAYAKLLAE